MIIEILFVLFIFALVFNTFYSVKLDYDHDGIKKGHLNLDVVLDKNIVKILRILGV